MKAKLFAAASLLSFYFGQTMAHATDCSADTAEVLDLFNRWWTYVEEEIAYEPRAALQDLKTEAERLGSALGELDAANHMLGRHADGINRVDQAQGPEAGFRAAENILYQVGWAGHSLTALSACLALVPVDVQHRNQITVAGALMTMRYVQPEIFGAIGTIDRELRANGMLTGDEGRALLESLRTVNRFVDISGGSFTECENTMLRAQVSGTLVRIPRYIPGAQETTTVAFDAATAMMTLGAADAACRME